MNTVKSTNSSSSSDYTSQRTINIAKSITLKVRDSNSELSSDIYSLLESVRSKISDLDEQSDEDIKVHDTIMSNTDVDFESVLEDFVSDLEELESDVEEELQ